MIDAMLCRINSYISIDEYCTREIEPLLLKAKGQPIYFGKYNSDGTEHYYIGATYAKDRPSLKALGRPEVSPKNIENYLRKLGYQVEWVQMQERYPAGYSSSKRTCYYSSGYNTYYSLKIYC